MADDNELASLRRDLREMAREEAKAVYDDLGVVDGDGEEWSLCGLMSQFQIDRRTALQAIGLITVGFAAPTAVLHAMTGTASAAATGQEGTQTDPLTKLWTHEIESGDGASDLTITGPANIDGDPAGGFGSESGIAPGFDSWTQVSSSRPAFVWVTGTVQTDGTSAANVLLDVDDSGGTTRDYFLRLAFAGNDLPSGADVGGTAMIYLPAGAQFQINNDLDPNNANNINEVRQLIL